MIAHIWVDAVSNRIYETRDMPVRLENRTYQREQIVIGFTIDSQLQNSQSTAHEP